MRRHCEIGFSVLERIPFLKEAAEIVLSHQECYDGSGYPRGLKGEEIPLGARIFAVADTLDAMISDRPYRKALPISAARDESDGFRASSSIPSRGSFPVPSGASVAGAARKVGDPFRAWQLETATSSTPVLTRASVVTRALTPIVLHRSSEDERMALVPIKTASLTGYCDCIHGCYELANFRDDDTGKSYCPRCAKDHLVMAIEAWGFRSLRRWQRLIRKNRN